MLMRSPALRHYVKDTFLRLEENSWPVIIQHSTLHLEDVNKTTNDLWVETLCAPQEFYT
jgi:hypothetical protein